MIKFLLVIFVFILIFLIAIGIFIRKVMKLFGISKKNVNMQNVNQSKNLSKSEEVLFKDGDITVLRGDAKNDEPE